MCKSVDYGFIAQVDKVFILNIPPTRERGFARRSAHPGNKQKDDSGFAFDHRDDIYPVV